MKKTAMLAAVAPMAAFAGGMAAPALDTDAWEKSGSVWLSSPDAKVETGKIGEDSTSAPGTDWFMGEIANAKKVESVRWMTAGLGVYEIFVNGGRVGEDFLKPGFTHPAKTKYAFTYDVTDLVKTGEGEVNRFVAEASAGWWRDKIVTPYGRDGFTGSRSAFRGVIEFTFDDGTKELRGTTTREWRAATCGPVMQADIFSGETFDARVSPDFGDASLFKTPLENTEFKGEILPTAGAEIRLRRDLAMKGVRAYVWKGVKDARRGEAGKVEIARECEPGGRIGLDKGETLVVDFGQNAAAVPAFAFSAAAGTVLEARPAEMLNDGNGAEKRGCDGPEGSVYRKNLRGDWKNRRLARYVFAGKGVEEYMPRFTFFGYRYLSVTADGPVEFESIESVPVSSVARDMERGTLKTGDECVNRLFLNAYWGQLSNYLSVPTDCPQRNERLGWAADTQVFCETALYNADVADFLRKWMRDMRDSQDAKGGFPGVAPKAQYGGDFMRTGWSDAGVIVPWTVWRQSGGTAIIDENWDAMERFLARIDETEYRTRRNPEARNYQWNDWLSLDRLESCALDSAHSAFDRGPDGRRIVKEDAYFYWDYLGACHWLRDARMMSQMAAATGRADAVAKYDAMSAKAKAYLEGRFFADDGTLSPVFKGMQTPAVFAIHLGLVEGEALDKTKAALRRSIEKDCGGTLRTGFLGTALALETLVGCGMEDLAYSLLLNHKYPGWLYSVDQGATTAWERWNSYTKETGFGPVSMNSFNHYAYGCVAGWLYKDVAGIRPGEKGGYCDGFVLAPVPDRRLGSVDATLSTPKGEIRSAWEYGADGRLVWRFTVPAGTEARARLGGRSETVPGPAECVWEM